MLMPNLPRLRAPITALCLLAAGFAQAESGAYLKLSGIEGVHRTDPYRGWSEVQGLNFKISREVVRRRVVVELNVRDRDVASFAAEAQARIREEIRLPAGYYIKWGGQMVRGRPLEETRFQLVADGPGGLATVAQLRLSGAYLTGLSLNGGEFSGALSVDGFGFGHKAFDGKGSLGAQQDTGYDFSDAHYDAKLSTPFGGYAYRGKPFGPGGTAADNSIFVRHDQANEGGASRVKGYENWSEVSGMSWSASASFGLGGGGGGSVVGRAEAGELVWLQGLDNAAFQGLDDLFGSQENDELVMEFVRHTQAGPVTFMQLVFRDFQFNEWGLQGGSVQQGLSFGSVVQTVWAIGLDGKRGAPTSIGWDVLENKLLAGARPVGPADGFGNGGLNGSVSAVPEPQGALMPAAGCRPAWPARPAPRTYRPRAGWPGRSSGSRSRCCRRPEGRCAPGSR